MSTSPQDVYDTIAKLVNDHGLADVTNLIDWSRCIDTQKTSEDSNIELFTARLKVGYPVTIRAPRLFLSNPRIRSGGLVETEFHLAGWFKYQHEHVLQLFGVAMFRDQIAMITCEEGVILHEHLTRTPNADRCLLATHISSGLAYLHGLGVTHPRIKGSNVAVFSGGIAKLGGFDLFYDVLTTDHSPPVGTSVWWMAHEQLFGSPRHTHETNVYALGMTILETFTGKRPYAEVSNLSQFITEVMMQNTLPRRPFWLTPEDSQTDNMIWSLLTDCWQRDPKARPSARSVERQMASIQQQHANSKFSRDYNHPISPTRVTIESTMSASDVIKHLTLHDCPNVTTELNLPLCQDKPTYGGGFSDVYKGNLLSGIPVAIKCLRLSSTATDHNSKVHKHAAHELYTWSKLKHANVLELLGLALFRGQIAMVSPWMNQGDLCSYAIRHPDASRCELCTQVINGLAYMHSQGVIHGDLKAANVLVSFDGIAKLADFGCTTLKQDSTVQFTRTGTVNFSLRWAAPELLTDEGSASVASDVYALAMTIMEVVSGRIPYYNKRDTVVMNLVVLAKVTPERPEEISTDSEEGNSLWRLLQSCWRYDPVGRPTVAEIGKLMKPLRDEALKYGSANGS